jgi:hypothetical protein
MLPAHAPVTTIASQPRTMLRLSQAPAATVHRIERSLLASTENVQAWRRKRERRAARPVFDVPPVMRKIQDSRHPGTRADRPRPVDRLGHGSDRLRRRRRRRRRHLPGRAALAEPPGVALQRGTPKLTDFSLPGEGHAVPLERDAPQLETDERLARRQRPLKVAKAPSLNLQRLASSAVSSAAVLKR